VKKIRYTDTRYQNGYTPASQTDISKTFKRVHAELKARAAQEAANQAEAQSKTLHLPRKVAK